MNNNLIITVFLITLALVIGYRIAARQKHLAKLSERRKIARLIASFDKTEALFANVYALPISSTLNICLNKKMLNILYLLHELNPKDKQISKKIHQMQQQLHLLQNSETIEKHTKLQTPINDNQAISMLKFVKSLIKIIETEQKNKQLSAEDYHFEKEQLEQLQIKINLENAFRKIEEAQKKGQLGTAEELIERSIQTLADNSDDYSLAAKERLNSSLIAITKNLDSDFKEIILARDKENKNFLDPL